MRIWKLDKLAGIYKKILGFFCDMRMAWKFTVTYFIIIALPIILTGIYISSSTTKSIVHQSEFLTKQSLLQKKEIINQKIESMERTSISIAYNPQILKYIEDPFENNIRGYENYIYTFAPLIESYIIQSRYIYNTVLYVSNKTFPDSWNGIYHIDSIENDELYRPILAKNAVLENWSPVHDSKNEKLTGAAGAEKVFSLHRKLISFRDKSCIGVLELEISAKILFKNLENEKDIVEYYFVLDDKENIVSENTYKDMPEKYKASFTSALLSESDLNGILKFGNEQMVVLSIPLNSIGCRLVGITPLEKFLRDNPNYRMTITGVIVVALILFGTLIHFVSNRLTRRLKMLVKGLKSVREGNINIKMHTGSRDEFGELAESFNHMTHRIHELIERVYKAQIMEKESELKALEAQINPHFLYNSLSTISWMARKVKAGNIDNLAFLLSKFYRLVLSKGNSVISVEDEIELLKAYVQIEKTRFDDLFEVEYDLDEEAFRHKMIKIILQPIAENAINHGIAPKGCKGTLIVRLRQDDENLYFTIIDDGVGMSRNILESINKGEIVKKRESGYAIQNILERIKAVYGEKGSVTISSSPGIGCSVSIVIPKHSMFLNL